MPNTKQIENDDLDRRERGVRVRDLTVAVDFPDLRVDEAAREELGRYVKPLTISIFHTAEEEDTDTRVALGELDCFLFDAICADSEDDSLFPEVDYEANTLEFYEFLFDCRTDLIRAGVLRRLHSDTVDDDEDDYEGIDLCNALCINGGWWACRSDVLAHVLGRLQHTLRFSLVCVDTAHIRTVPCGSTVWWKTDKPETPLSMPEPFQKIVWGDTADRATLSEDAWERFFWVSYPDTALEMNDDDRVQLASVADGANHE